MSPETRRKIEAALAHLPTECRYHGANLDRADMFPGACCETGAAARARREVETALRGEGDSP